MARCNIRGTVVGIRRALVAGMVSTGCATPDQTATVPEHRTEPPVVEPTEPAEAQAPARPAGPVITEAAARAHRAVQETMMGGTLDEHPLVHHVPIDDPTGQALAHFHRALQQLGAGEDSDGKVRVAVWGASSVAADRYTAYLRGYLQQRFGDGGVGFVALVPLWRWHRHNEVAVRASKSWTIEHAQKEKTGRLDGYYGLLGASAWATRKASWAELRGRTGHTDPSGSHLLELWFLRQPAGGRFDVELAGKRVATVQTRADAHGPGYWTPSEPPAAFVPLRVKVRGDGEVRLFGAVLERDAPGVVVDELGIGGTRAANHLGWDEGTWSDNLRRRAPDLWVLAYGANEAIDEDEPIETYRESLEAVIVRLRRHLPDASCLLVGPQDFPVQTEDGTWQARPRLDAIIDAQRDIAAARGCGFFDTRAFMGGKGSMEQWVAADPPLAKSDHLHLTPLGYLHLGKVLTDALMADFDASDRPPDRPVAIGS